MSLRRGLLRDVTQAFRDLRALSPSEDQESLVLLENEVLAELRGIAYTARQTRIVLDAQNACIQSLVDQKARLEEARVAALKSAAQSKVPDAYPYAFSLGDRVRVIKGGAFGTVEAISRDYGMPRSITYGVAVENKGGLYYYPAGGLESAP